MSQAKLQRYQGAIFDSDHWTRMHLRAGDVVVSTPPKSGTTWTLAMIYLLLRGPDVSFDNISNVTPWIDRHGAESVPTGDERRVFKTHTPLDGIPIVEGVEYISVFRDPGATFLSMRRHLTNMVSVPAGHLNTGPWPHALDHFLNGPMRRDHFGGVTLETIRHFLSCAQSSATLLLHYADMIADPPAVLRQLALQLDVDRSDEEHQRIARITGRDNMAREANRFTPDAKDGFFKEKERFFTSFQTAEEQFSAQEMFRLCARLEETFDPADVMWLARGN